jgi:hypothetical protein
MTSKQSQASGKIPPQQAAEQAAQYLRAFVTGATNITVEEVELSPDAAHWRITLSYLAGPLLWGPKTYKVFDIDTQSGEVLAMRIREG